MNIPLRPFLVLLLLVAARIEAAETFDEALKRAAGNYQREAQQAAQDLNLTRDRLANERAPLLRAKQAAEDSVLTLEREILRLETQTQRADERRRKLLKEQESIRKTVNYLNSLSRDSLKAFAEGLAPGENQIWAEDLQTLQQKLDAAAGATSAQPAADVLEFIRQSNERALGGYTAPGRAVLAGDNEVRPGTLAFLGPEAFFLPAGDGPGTTLRLQTGTTYPTAHPLSNWTRPEVEAFFSGRPGYLMADAARGKALQLQATRGSLQAHIRSGGTVAYIILATGLLALILILQKFRDLAQMRLDRPAVVQGLLAAVAAGATAEAEKRLAPLRQTTHELLATGLRHSRGSKALLEDQLQSVLHRQQMHFERRLSLLAVIATAAPLLGLLGTVSGMVKTFALMTVFGTGNAMKLSAGISEVLVATELGLMVAIPTLVVHGFLAHRIRKNLSLLEHYAMDFVVAVDSANAAAPTRHETTR